MTFDLAINHSKGLGLTDEDAIARLFLNAKPVLVLFVMQKKELDLEETFANIMLKMTTMYDQMGQIVEDWPN